MFTQAQVTELTNKVRRLTPPSTDHEGLALDILFEVWQAGRLAPTFLDIRSRCTDEVRRRYAEAKNLSGIPPPAVPESEFESIQRRDQVELLMRSSNLTNLEKKAIWYRYYAELDLTEIAKKLSQPINTVRQVLTTALFKMRQANE